MTSATAADDRSGVGQVPGVARAAVNQTARPDEAPVLVWTMSSAGSGESFSTGWLSFTGRALDDELGEGWLAAVHSDDRQALLSGLQDVAARDQPADAEFRLMARDGGYRWVLARTMARRTPDGTVAGIVGAALDVTERHMFEAERRKLLVGANEAIVRLATLHDLTARLAGLTRPEEVAEVVLGQGVADLGASTGSLCLLSGDGRHLEVAAQVGYPSEVSHAWARFTLEAPTPAGDAVRSREAIYISSLAELAIRYPIFGDTPIVGDEAVACLPLITGGNQALGAMVMGFAEARSFPPADQRLLTALAAQAATALSRTQSRADLEAAREQLAYLADASSRLAATLDVQQTLATISSLSVPRLADRCSLCLVNNGQVETLVLEPADPGMDIRTFLARFPVDLTRSAGIGAVFRTGRPQFIPELDEAMLAEGVGSPERNELLRRIGFGAALILPLIARGRTLGVMALTNSTGRTMTEQQRSLAEELGARAAVALDNAQLFAQQTDVAHRLQASLLPPVLPTIAGIDLAARYAAAGEGAEVGGDFYDCIACGPNRWLVVVGDVKGKGVDAAALTGMARHTIRAAALMVPGPAAVLSLLNQVLIGHESERTTRQSHCHSDDRPTDDRHTDDRHTDDRPTDDGPTGDRPIDEWEASEPRFCTVVAVQITTAGDGFEVTAASAGHPLPLLRHPDGQVTTIGAPGPLLGIHREVELRETTLTLVRGSALVCFTDGVSECHHGQAFFDEDGVASVVAAGHGSAEEMAEGIEMKARSFARGGEIRDDMAILVVRVP